jgi:hypothetical protein
MTTGKEKIAPIANPVARPCDIRSRVQFLLFFPLVLVPAHGDSVRA